MNHHSSDADVTMEREPNRPRQCCTQCFGDDEFKDYIRKHGAAGHCGYCGSTDVQTIDPEELWPLLSPKLQEYTRPLPGRDFDPSEDDVPGDPLSLLLGEDEPDLFSDLVPYGSQRDELLQAILDGADAGAGNSDPRSALDVNDLLVRDPESEYEEYFFRGPPDLWSEFTDYIRTHRRFLLEGLSEDADPSKYLTRRLLDQLVYEMPAGQQFYRAVRGGKRGPTGDLTAYPAPRMAGPNHEHCQHGGRVNPPGIPMLYGASDASTAIAEIRPFVGAPVSVATLSTVRPLRLINFSPKTIEGAGVSSRPLPDPNRSGTGVFGDMLDVLDTIGREMSRPVDPDASEIEYAPTQFVAEHVRAQGYDGVVFTSALSSGDGINIVLFDKADARVMEVRLFKVDEVRYKASIHPDTTF